MNGLHRNPKHPEPAELNKWEFLRDAPEADSRNPKLAGIAQHLMAAALGRPIVFLALAHALARDGIRFERDVARVGSEDISGLTRPAQSNDATDALERGEDDCDAKARFFVALCMAGGFRARMVDWWRATGHGSDMLAHVSAEVGLGQKWLPVELTLARARLGELGDDVPKEKDGGLRLT